jgi:thiamine-phosphate pyrophosphorylase
LRGLYAIADAGALQQRGLTPIAFAEAVLSVRPAALQLRAKNAPARETLALLRELASMCRRAAVPLVANDRPDFAVLSGCDLVHVGQLDMPVHRVRQLAPGIGIGVSTHTLAQLEVALATRPSYVAFGPVFATSTKADPDPVVGIVALRAARALAGAMGIPLVAIGGLSYERVRSMIEDVDAVAVISGLFPQETEPGLTKGDLLAQVEARAAAFQALFAPRPGSPVEAPR